MRLGSKCSAVPRATTSTGAVASSMADRDCERDHDPTVRGLGARADDEQVDAALAVDDRGRELLGQRERGLDGGLVG